MKVTKGAWMIVAALGAMGPATAFAFGGGDGAPAGVSPAREHGGASIAAPADSSAPAPVTKADLEVLILYGSNDHSGIDPQIGKLPELAKPPFSSFDSYKLLDRKTLSLDKGTSKDVALATGSTLTVTLKDIILPTPKDAQKSELRFVVDESITNGAKTVLPNLEVNAKRGEFFFVAGEKYKEGALVIGTRVK